MPDLRSDVALGLRDPAGVHLWWDSVSIAVAAQAWRTPSGAVCQAVLPSVLASTFRAVAVPIVGVRGGVVVYVDTRGREQSENPLLAVAIRDLLMGRLTGVLVRLVGVEVVRPPVRITCAVGGRQTNARGSDPPVVDVTTGGYVVVGTETSVGAVVRT